MPTPADKRKVGWAIAGALTFGVAGVAGMARMISVALEKGFLRPRSRNLPHGMAHRVQPYRFSRHGLWRDRRLNMGYCPLATRVADGKVTGEKIWLPRKQYLTWRSTSLPSVAGRR